MLGYYEGKIYKIEDRSLKNRSDKKLRVNFDIWKCWIIMAITLFIRKKLFYLYTMKRFKKLKSVGLQYYGDNFIHTFRKKLFYLLYNPICFIYNPELLNHLTNSSQLIVPS